VVESAKDRRGFERAGGLDRAMDWAIFAQRPMRAGLVVIGRISRQDSAQVRGTENRDVVDDFAPD
jgi:hypothetical protein